MPKLTQSPHLLVRQHAEFALSSLSLSTLTLDQPSTTRYNFEKRYLRVDHQLEHHVAAGQAAKLPALN